MDNNIYNPGSLFIWNATPEAVEGLKHCGIPKVNIDMTQL